MNKHLQEFSPTKDAMEKNYEYVSGSCAIIFAECMFESWDFRDEHICLAFKPEVAPIAKALAALFNITLVESTQYKTDASLVLLDMTDKVAALELAMRLMRSS